MLVLESSRSAGRGGWTQTAVAVGLLAFAAATAFLGRGPLPLGVAFVVGLFAVVALYVQFGRPSVGRRD